jgi:hypothetical protein
MPGTFSRQSMKNWLRGGSYGVKVEKNGIIRHYTIDTSFPGMDKLCCSLEVYFTRISRCLVAVGS